MPEIRDVLVRDPRDSANMWLLRLMFDMWSLYGPFAVEWQQVTDWPMVFHKLFRDWFPVLRMRVLQANRALGLFPAGFDIAPQQPPAEYTWIENGRIVVFIV